jgi:hypothetical protein
MINLLVIIKLYLCNLKLTMQFLVQLALWRNYEYYTLSDFIYGFFALILIQQEEIHNLRV